MLKAGEILKHKVVPFGSPWAIAGETNTLEIIKGEFKAEKSLKGQLFPFCPLAHPQAVSSLPPRLVPLLSLWLFILHFFQKAFLDQTHLYLALSGI